MTASYSRALRTVVAEVAGRVGMGTTPCRAMVAAVFGMRWGTA